MSRFRNSKAPSSASTAPPQRRRRWPCRTRRTPPRRRRCCRSTVQAGSRLSYRPQLLTLSDVVVTSGKTKVVANGIFGSPDDVCGSTAPDGSRTCARCCWRSRHRAWRTWSLKVRPASNAVASGTFERPILKGSLEVDDARLGDGDPSALRGGVGPRRARRRADPSRSGRGAVAGRAPRPVRDGADVVRAPARIVADQRAGDDLRARRRRDPEGAGAVCRRPTP